MRLSAIFLRLAVFGIAGFGAFAAAETTVHVVEERSVQAVQETLADQGYDWATVLGDGLQVILEGRAPTEAQRFRAISATGGVVDASRVIDNMSVADSAVLAPPKFAIEILRNDSGVSLIGLIPATTDRDRLARQITDIADGQAVTDLLEGGDYPTPDTWRDAMAFALRALEMLPRAKISVAADEVTINAIADSTAEKRQLETALARNTPEGVRLAISISAPRPVISPFTARFVLDETGAHFDACAADTEEARDQIIAAAVAAGFEPRRTLILALGHDEEVMGTDGTIWLNNFLRTGFEMFTAPGKSGYVAEKAESASGWLFPVGDETLDGWHMWGGNPGHAGLVESAGSVDPHLLASLERPGQGSM